MRKFSLVFPLFFLLLSCGGKKVSTKAPNSTLDEPDRSLYDRAMKDISKNRFTVARLTLQTLINTYPDSEYLPQAKYAMAESFYKESSSSSLSQAENEFKDYITFFPTSPLADDAQLKVAMTHIRRIEKADRDTTQARLAEIELKSMIDNYPDSDLLEEAKVKLRAVQEVLADHDNGIGNFYLHRKDYAAALSRYKEVVTKYPDYSKMPDTLFHLGDSLEHAGNEPESAIYFGRIITEHPLSVRVSDAKRRLTAANQPIPEPSPGALARAQESVHDDKGMLGKVFNVFKGRPSVPTDTKAASTDAIEGEPAETSQGGVRGGTSGSSVGTGSRSNDGNSFSIDPTAVTAPPQPAKTR